jgi:hypothetical protein
MHVLRLVIAWIALCNATGWCAEQFPAIEGENLLGRKIALPQAGAGYPRVVVIGFTHASQSQTKTWSARLHPEVATYSLAVLQDVPRLVRGMAVAGIKSGVPQEQRERFLLVFSGEKELKEAVGFDRPNDAYLILMDADGAIRWRFHGELNDSSLAELKTHVADLQKAP